jgi:uncharacterized lipoprotein YehR (DUF1307 family)
MGKNRKGKGMALLAVSVLLAGCARADYADSPRNKAPVLSEDTSSSVTACAKEGSTIVLQATGDQIDTYVQEFSMARTSLELDPELDEEAVIAKALELTDSVYSGIEGVSVSARVQDDLILYTVVIDYTAANLEQLAVHGLISQAQVQNQFVSLSKTKSSLESSNYACQVE